MKTIDVSDVPVDTLEELSQALNIIIKKRLTNSSSTIEMMTKQASKKRVKIHDIKPIRNSNLNLNSVKQIDDLLHKVIIKRFKNFNYKDDEIKKKRIGKSSEQLIKNSYNPVFDANKFPDLTKSKLCRYDLDFLPVKIVNNDQNVLSDVKLNVLTRKNIENNCKDD